MSPVVPTWYSKSYSVANLRMRLKLSINVGKSSSLTYIAIEGIISLDTVNMTSKAKKRKKKETGDPESTVPFLLAYSQYSFVSLQINNLSSILISSEALLMCSVSIYLSICRDLLK